MASDLLGRFLREFHENSLRERAKSGLAKCGAYLWVCTKLGSARGQTVKL